MRRARFAPLGLLPDRNSLLHSFVATGLGPLVLGAAVLAAPLVLPAQTPGAQHIETAREMLKMAKLDSAMVLLRLVIDSQAPSSTGERVDAWVLLGIAEYYRGNESAAADAFRRVLALAPEAQVKLPDPALQRIFDGLRPSAPVAGMPAAAAPGSADTVYDCVPQCPWDVQAPRVRFSPSFVSGTLLLSPNEMRVPLSLVVQGVVDTSGYVERASVTPIHWTGSVSTLQSLTDTFLRTHFVPGRRNGRAVRVRIEHTIHVRLR